MSWTILSSNVIKSDQYCTLVIVGIVAWFSMSFCASDRLGELDRNSCAMLQRCVASSWMKSSLLRIWRDNEYILINTSFYFDYGGWEASAVVTCCRSGSKLSTCKGSSVIFPAPSTSAMAMKAPSLPRPKPMAVANSQHGNNHFLKNVVHSCTGDALPEMGVRDTRNWRLGTAVEDRMSHTSTVPSANPMAMTDGCHGDHEAEVIELVFTGKSITGVSCSTKTLEPFFFF